MSEIFSFRGKIKSLDELNKIEKPVRNEIYYCEENDLHFFWNGCKWICINDEMIKELAKEHEVRGIMSYDNPLLAHVIEQINKLQAELLEWKIKLADMIVNGSE